MSKEFVPYDIALAMKELGFDEPCLGVFELIVVGDTIPKFRYNWKSEDRWFNHNKEKNKFKDHDWYWSAPLYQQAFRWFREKYRLSVLIHDCLDDYIGEITEWTIIEDKIIHEVPNRIETYEEAELACLRKIIEIVEEK